MIKIFRCQTKSFIFYPTIILPSGKIEFIFDFFLNVKATISEIGPTLPINIVIANTVLDIADKSGVIPADIPTVPKAETDSNIISIAENDLGASITSRILVSIAKIIIHNITIVNDL